MSLTSFLLIRELSPRATLTASPYMNKNGKVTKKKKKFKTSCLGYLASKAEFQALVTGPFSLQIVERTRKNRAWLL